jgi:hypothetical protein
VHPREENAAVLQEWHGRYFDSGEHFLAQQGMVPTDIVPVGPPPTPLLMKTAPSMEQPRGKSRLATSTNQ